MDFLETVGRLTRLLGTGRYSFGQLADGTGVLLNLEGLTVLSMNRTGMKVISLLREGEIDAERLISEIATPGLVSRDLAKRDLDAFLSRLLASLEKSAC